MRSIHIAASVDTPAATQVFWIPGAYHSAQDFLDAGFAAAVARRGLPLDLTFVDLELEHLLDRRALASLRTELVEPARRRGAAVWLGGISLGGMLALDYAARHPEDLTALCLLAPYLGNRGLTAEIQSAPGLDAWEPGELAETDEERRIWRYIKHRRAGSLPLYLGFGKDDRFGASHRLLAQTLDPAAVNVIEGAHDWRTWMVLWEDFLDSTLT